MRRCVLLAILACVSPASVHAQTGPGTIYYNYGPTSADPYKVSGDGTNNLKLWTGLPSAVQVTALATYPGGRQLAILTQVGGIPGTTLTYGDLTLRSEQGATPTTMTNLRGPQYVQMGAPRVRFSNDQRDSFVSFLVYDTRISTYILVRYNGPIADVFQPGFVPFTSDDPRLTTLTVTTLYDYGTWDSTGTKLFYFGKDAAGNTLVYVYDAVANASTLVNDPVVSGWNLTRPVCSSTEFRLFGTATYKDGTKGIASFYPTTGQFKWVIKEGGNGSNYIDLFSSSAVSPDGTTLAFGMRRMVGKYIRPSLVRVPANGGSYTPLVTYTDSNLNTFGVLGWRW